MLQKIRKEKEKPIMMLGRQEKELRKNRPWRCTSTWLRSLWSKFSLYLWNLASDLILTYQSPSLLPMIFFWNCNACFFTCSTRCKAETLSEGIRGCSYTPKSTKDYIKELIFIFLKFHKFYFNLQIVFGGLAPPSEIPT